MTAPDSSGPGPDSAEARGCGSCLSAGPAPGWIEGLAGRLRDEHRTAPHRLLRSRLVPPGVRTRSASVLILFGDACGEAPGPDGPSLDGVPDADVLLTQRSASLRHHSGQVAFPGGKADPGDEGPVHTALREAREETGLRPEGVEPLVVMDELFLPPSRFLVSPVLGYWREPCPVGVVDAGETARVSRVPLRDLVDPANRFQVRYRKMFKGPAFAVDGMLVWGFTAGLLTALIAEAGWERPWDTDDVRELDMTLAEVDEQASPR